MTRMGATYFSRATLCQEGSVIGAEGDMPLSEGNILPSVGGGMTAEGGMSLSPGGILPSGGGMMTEEGGIQPS